jgi:hypothetical protein
MPKRGSLSRAGTAAGRVMLVSAFLAAFGSSPVGVHAAGPVTVSICDETHLRAAIIAAGAGSKITFGCSGTIGLASTITFDTSSTGLTIDGTGQNVTVSGQDTVGVFSVAAGVRLTLTHLTVANGVTSDGGGVLNAGALDVLETTLRDNVGSVAVRHGGGFGGAILNTSTGTLNVVSSTFIRNSAPGVDITGGSGGAIENLGTLHVTNSTFTDNIAHDVFGEGSGGAIHGDGPGTVTNSTFSGNSADKGGAMSSPNMRVTSSILANSGGGNCSSAPIDGGDNLDDGATCGFSTTNHSRSNTDPKLLPLAANGGSTQTLALAATSPAIDAVVASTCPATDQRGVARPQDGNLDGRAVCDIGAFELQPQVTFASLCTQSRQMVTNRALAMGMCRVLDDAQRSKERGLPSVKDRLLSTYAGLVDAAQRIRAVTAERAVVLKSLAATL